MTYKDLRSKLNDKAQSRLVPSKPHGLIIRKEFDLLKSKFDTQVEALKLKCKKKESAFDDSGPSKSPFTQEVLDAPIPNKFKPPTMKHYDGPTNPKDYVEVFEGLIDFKSASDAIKCRAF